MYRRFINMELTADSSVSPNGTKLISSHAFSPEGASQPSCPQEHLSTMPVGHFQQQKYTKEAQKCDERGMKRTSFYSIRAETSKIVVLPQLRTT